MISGRSALGFIDESLGNERSSIDTAERQIADVSRQLLEQQQARVADYRELAGLRVDMMAAGSMISSIDVVSKQVAAALEVRKTAEEELDARIIALHDERAALEVERENQRQALEQVAETLDIAEAATQARLDADPEYMDQEQRVREAERIAMHADD